MPPKAAASPKKDAKGKGAKDGKGKAEGDAPSVAWQDNVQFLVDTLQNRYELCH